MTRLPVSRGRSSRPAGLPRCRCASPIPAGGARWRPACRNRRAGGWRCRRPGGCAAAPGNRRGKTLKRSGVGETRVVSARTWSRHAPCWVRPPPSPRTPVQVTRWPAASGAAAVRGGCAWSFVGNVGCARAAPDRRPHKCGVATARVALQRSPQAFSRGFSGACKPALNRGRETGRKGRGFVRRTSLKPVCDGTIGGCPFLPLVCDERPTHSCRSGPRSGA